MITADEIVKKLEACCAYILGIYKPLAFHPEALSISYESDAEGNVVFLVSGDKEDDGVYIGKGGGTVDAIRLLVHAYAKSNLQEATNGKDCLVKVNDHKGSNYNPALAKKPFNKFKKAYKPAGTYNRYEEEIK